VEAAVGTRDVPTVLTALSGRVMVAMGYLDEPR
jgi:hypothetical protein